MSEQVRQTGTKKRHTALWCTLGALALLLIGAVVFLLNLFPGGREREPVSGSTRPQRAWVSVEKDDLACAEGLPKESRTLLLMVCDPQAGGAYGPTDTMLLATVNARTGKADMTVLQARLLVDIPGVGRDTLAQAYATGGENLALKTINQVFGLNVRDFVTIDLNRFGAVVDLLGGIQMPLTEAEAEALGLAPGQQTLTAGQTLAYMRMPPEDPATDRPYNVVMQTLYQGSRDKNPGRLVELLRGVLASMDTNVNMLDMISLGMAVMGGSERAEIRLPAPDQLTAVQAFGEACYETDLDAARRALHAFLFPADPR
ncbi:MAG: LCP family protein [Oscillospiraceae bacterium]|jgi:LCP family protein required for cell wall assembly|nr:LCP family protein [Oscillospiraceae bacterium]